MSLQRGVERGEAARSVAHSVALFGDPLLVDSVHMTIPRCSTYGIFTYMECLG